MVDLEEKYTDGIEKEEEAFLEGLQNKKVLVNSKNNILKKLKRYEKFMRDL